LIVFGSSNPIGRARTAKGKLQEQKSKSLTIHNLSFDEVYERIRSALSPG
jgi:hypothetical protein